MANLEAAPYPRALAVTPNYSIVDGDFQFEFDFETGLNVTANGPADFSKLTVELYNDSSRPDNGTDEHTFVLPADNDGVVNYFTQAAAGGFQNVNLGNSALVGADLTGLTEVDSNGTQEITFASTISGGDSTSLVAGTSGVQGIDVGGSVTGGTATGLANDSTTYSAFVVVDGLTIEVSLAGSTVQTYTDLVDQINTDLASLATVAIDSGDLLITSISTGVISTIDITDVDLFSTLTTFSSVLTAVDGIDQTYDIDINIDSAGVQTLVVSGEDVLTYFALVSKLNELTVAAGFDAEWTITTTGSLLLTSNSLGTASVVAIVDGSTGGAVLPLIAGLLPAATIQGAAGGALTAYTMEVTVVGTGAAVLPISVDSSAATTLATLVSEIDTDLTGASAALVNGEIVITHDVTGLGEDVSITDEGTLIPALVAQFGTHVVVETAVPGVDDGAGKAFGDVGITGSFSTASGGLRGKWILTIPGDVADTLPNGTSNTTLLPIGFNFIEYEVQADDMGGDTYFYGDIDAALGFTQRELTFVKGSKVDLFNDGVLLPVQVLDDTTDVNAIQVLAYQGMDFDLFVQAQERIAAGAGATLLAKLIDGGVGDTVLPVAFVPFVLVDAPAAALANTNVVAAAPAASDPGSTGHVWIDITVPATPVFYMYVDATIGWKAI